MAGINSRLVFGVRFVLDMVSRPIYAHNFFVQRLTDDELTLYDTKLPRSDGETQTGALRTGECNLKVH